MTACDDVRQSIGAYVLGALPPDEAATVSLHLESCPECAAELAALAPLPGLLGAASGAAAATEEPLPPAFEERLLDAYAHEHAVAPPRRRRRRLPRLRWLVPAGGVVAAAAVALVLVLGGGDDDPEAPRYDIAFRPAAATVSPATARGYMESLDEGTELHIWLAGLPRDPDAVYEVLCDADSWTATAGTFRTDANGKAYVVMTTALRRGEYDTIRVVRRSHRRDGRLVKRDLLAARVS